MSTETLAQELDTATTTESTSLLTQAIGATKQTDASRAEELLRTLTEEALKGTVQWNKNMTVTFNEAIQLIDQKISKQLSVIMHHEDFQKLEGSWRGLNHLVMNSDTGSTLKIRVLNMKKKELHKDLSKAVEFDQSQTFKKIYESEFGTPGGEPYGTIVGDFEFTNHPEDVETLGLMSNVAAAGFCPFISASSPSLFGFDSWEELTKPRDLKKYLNLLNTLNGAHLEIAMIHALFHSRCQDFYLVYLTVQHLNLLKNSTMKSLKLISLPVAL